MVGVIFGSNEKISRKLLAIEACLHLGEYCQGYEGLTAIARAKKEQRSDALAVFRDFET